MAVLDTAIHAFGPDEALVDAGTSPAMTVRRFGGGLSKART